MKPFLLFAGDSYYPSGGWNDFVLDYDTVEEAKEGLSGRSADWAHVVNEIGMVVAWWRKPRPMIELDPQRYRNHSTERTIKDVARMNAETVKYNEDYAGWH